MNFLSLVQRAFNYCAVEGTQPANVQGQTGMGGRFVNWVQDAYADIQNEHSDWFFLESPFSFNTIVDNGSYSKSAVALNELASYKITSSPDGMSGIRCYKETQDEYDMVYIPYDIFYKIYQIGSNRTMSGKPSTFTVDPGSQMLLWPIPDDVYNINGRYFKIPDIMEINEDEPIIPSQFHTAIIFRAMMYYAGFEESSSVYSHGFNEYSKIMRKLEMNQIPMMKKGPPLA